MHPKEAKKEKVGTGRMTHLSLPNSSLIIDYKFDQNKQFIELLNDQQYQHFLLYPGKNAVNISNEPLKVEESKTPLIFILDGTWACAKSMIRDSKLLHNVARLSFSATITSAFAIKQQPASYCLSTIESVAIVIENLQRYQIENKSIATDTLHFQLLKMVHEQIKAANDELRPSYRKKTKTPYQYTLKNKYTGGSKKRSVCFIQEEKS